MRRTSGSDAGPAPCARRAPGSAHCRERALDEDASFVDSPPERNHARARGGESESAPLAPPERHTINRRDRARTVASEPFRYRECVSERRRGKQDAAAKSCTVARISARSARANGRAPRTAITEAIAAERTLFGQILRSTGSRANFGS